MNTIIVTESDIRKIAKNNRTRGPAEILNNPNPLPFDEFILKVKSPLLVWEAVVKVPNRYINIGRCDYNGKYFMWRRETENERNYITGKGGSKKEFTVMHDTLLMILSYIAGYERKTVQREKIPGCKTTASAAVKAPAAAPQNKIYLLSEVIEYVRSGADQIAEPEQPAVDKTKHNISCPAWGVRGHLRHYKSGKTVFIKAYEKGRERGQGKAKDKTYYLEKEGKK